MSGPPSTSPPRVTAGVQLSHTVLDRPNGNHFHEVEEGGGNQNTHVRTGWLRSSLLTWLIPDPLKFSVVMEMVRGGPCEAFHWHLERVIEAD